MSRVIKFLSTTDKLILEDGTEITIKRRKNKTSNFSIAITRDGEIGQLNIVKRTEEEIADDIDTFKTHLKKEK